jgi:hypothetical protein
MGLLTLGASERLTDDMLSAIVAQLAEQYPDDEDIGDIMCSEHDERGNYIRYRL